LGAGTLPSGSVIAVGTTGGEETHVLLTAEMPTHNHSIRCDAKNTVGSEVRRPRPADTADTDQDVSTTDTGGDLAHNNMPPYIGIHFIRRTARTMYRA
jgi:microcystin-dependent protein